jgi:hypothetical protein
MIKKIIPSTTIFALFGSQKIIYKRYLKRVGRSLSIMVNVIAMQGLISLFSS